MNRLHIAKATGVLFILFALLINIPYLMLVQTFEYDDILREPTDYVLTQFHAGGTQLIITWFCFGFLSLLFIPAAVLLQRLLEREDTPYLFWATLVGVLSSILQAIGLLRWTFVIPLLANLYVDPDSTDATRAAIVVVYQTIHQYGGVLIGEQLGQTLLVCWTIGIGFTMLRSPYFKPWLGWVGLSTVPFWIVGQTELFATVIPATPVFELTPIGFMIWEVWLLLIGVVLLRPGRQPRLDKR
ncbi:DUF4386 domain-containing protein [Oculatella sp. LEGE 06141]|uniref:DUF4386 domain-containing protein n=1 Tax=Oculatella sp. LEGE 06141 TaxID=1828648 RepID=UPI00188289E8|nr:DUF4386 domain-containing protein [Oculatella sp. LEGE 06141]MBE9182993.1 DUF4386 domain-containing protein [Oculatella sp. LEGE 06141]